MRYPKLVLIAAALLVLAALPAGAQMYSPYAYGDNGIRFRVGLFTPAGNSQYWNEASVDFTGNAKDLKDAFGGVDYLRRLNPRLSLLITGSGFEGKTRMAYRDYTDTRGNDVAHTTKLNLASFGIGLMVYLAPRNAPIVPYVGAGGGFYSYRLTETGDFIDFTSSTPYIFHDRFTANGTTDGYFYLAGLDIPLSPTWSVFAEARWHKASDQLGGDFGGFGKIDLSGRQIAAGMSWTF